MEKNWVLRMGADFYPAKKKKPCMNRKLYLSSIAANAEALKIVAMETMEHPKWNGVVEIAIGNLRGSIQVAIDNCVLNDLGITNYEHEYLHGSKK